MSEELNKPPKIIYLIPEGVSADGHCFKWVWCEDPAPAVGMEESDSVKYVRADIADEHITKAFATVI